MRFLAALLLMTTAALALPPVSKPDAKPPAAKPDSKPQVVSIDQLFAQLKKAESAEEAKPIEAKIEGVFRASGSPSVDLLMTRAQALLVAQDSKTALKLVKSVTQIAPNYAEGWHVRAAMESASDDDTNALISLQRVVALNPRQFSAMVELASMLEDYGDKKGALKLYRGALALDPQLDVAQRKIRELTTSVEGRDI